MGLRRVDLGGQANRFEVRFETRSEIKVESCFEIHLQVDLKIKQIPLACAISSRQLPHFPRLVAKHHFIALLRLGCLSAVACYLKPSHYMHFIVIKNLSKTYSVHDAAIRCKDNGLHLGPWSARTSSRWQKSSLF